MSYRDTIKKLLSKHSFTRAVYLGAVCIVGTRKTLFYDVDFFDRTGEAFCIREFLEGSEIKTDFALITDLFRKMHCAINTEVTV